MPGRGPPSRGRARTRPFQLLPRMRPLSENPRFPRGLRAWTPDRMTDQARDELGIF